LLSRLARDISIAGEKPTASLRFAVHITIGPIGIWVPYKIIADVDADVDAVVDADVDADVDANSIVGEVSSQIGCRFEMLNDSLDSGFMAGT